MWTVVYMTKNEEEAKSIVFGLKQNSIISKIRRNDLFIEVLVPDAELNSAHKIIIESNL